METHMTEMTYAVICLFVYLFLRAYGVKDDGKW